MDVRRCHAGDVLPSSLEGHSGLVLLGGQMGAYDDARFPWLTGAKALVVQAVAESTPFLGICLGHQLAAVALGGSVAPNPGGPVRGVLTLGLQPAATHDALAGVLREGARMLQWNSDVVSAVPSGACVLARDAADQVQMLRFGELAWGVQGHPEAGVDIVARWGAAQTTESKVPVVEELALAEADLIADWAPVAGAFFAATHAWGRA